MAKENENQDGEDLKNLLLGNMGEEEADEVEEAIEEIEDEDTDEDVLKQAIEKAENGEHISPEEMAQVIKKAQEMQTAKKAPAKAKKAAPAKAKKAKKAAPAKAAKSKKADTTKGKVHSAIAALAPELLDDDTDDEEVGDKPEGDRLNPIARPSGEDYRPRILGDKTDVEILRACRKDQIPVLLGGYPGCGKTAMVEAAFQDVYTLAGHGDMEVNDLVGTYVTGDSSLDEDIKSALENALLRFAKDGKENELQKAVSEVKETLLKGSAYEWVDGPLVKAMREGKVLFVDDCTLIPATVLARLYPAMDGRLVIKLTEHKGEEVKAAPGFYVCGAHNPGAPGAILSEALSSRFSLHMTVASDLRLANQLGVPKNITRVAASLQQMRDGQRVISWAPEMRELLTFKKVAKTLGTQTAANNMVAQAPEDMRDAVINALKTEFPDIEPLRLG